MNFCLLVCGIERNSITNLVVIRDDHRILSGNKIRTDSIAGNTDFFSLPAFNNLTDRPIGSIILPFDRVRKLTDRFPFFDLKGRMDFSVPVVEGHGPGLSLSNLLRRVRVALFRRIQADLFRRGRVLNRRFRFLIRRDRVAGDYLSTFRQDSRGHHLEDHHQGQNDRQKAFFNAVITVFHRPHPPWMFPLL